MKVFFVTRHKNAIFWAARNGLHAVGMTHREHLDLAEVEPGDMVFGTLPLHLAAQLCAKKCRYVHLSIQHDPALRGVELTIEQMDQKASLQEFQVDANEPLAETEFKPVALLVARHESTISWARQHRLIDANTRVLADLDVLRDVKPGQVVAGTLPPNVVADINARQATYLHLGMNLNREERGTTLAEDDLLARGFTVSEIQVSRVLKRTSYRIPLQSEDVRPVVMVSIASGQTLPNVIACAQYRMVGLLILHTDWASSVVAANRVEQAVMRLRNSGLPAPSISKQLYHPLSDAVGDSSLYRTLQNLRQSYALKFPDCRFIVNLSGGTKPMSFELGYLAERLNFERIYCDTEEGALRVFEDRQSVLYSALESFRSTVDVETYCAAQGYDVKSSHTDASHQFFPLGRVNTEVLAKFHQFTQWMLESAAQSVMLTVNNSRKGNAGQGKSGKGSGPVTRAVKKSYHAIIHQIANGFFIRPQGRFEEEFTPSQRVESNSKNSNERELSQSITDDIVSAVRNLGVELLKDPDSRAWTVTCPDEQTARFMKGLWFEYAFALAIEASLDALADRLHEKPQLRFGTKLRLIDQPAKGAEPDEVQELDVIMVYNNLMHIFELKAGWSFLQDDKSTDYKGATLKEKISGSLGKYQIVVPSASNNSVKKRMAYKRLNEYRIPVLEFTDTKPSMASFNDWVRSRVIEPALLKTSA